MGPRRGREPRGRRGGGGAVPAARTRCGDPDRLRRRHSVLGGRARTGARGRRRGRHRPHRARADRGHAGLRGRRLVARPRRRHDGHAPLGPRRSRRAADGDAGRALRGRSRRVDRRRPVRGRRPGVDRAGLDDRRGRDRPGAAGRHPHGQHGRGRRRRPADRHGRPHPPIRDNPAHRDRLALAFATVLGGTVLADASGELVGTSQAVAAGAVMAVISIAIVPTRSPR